MDGGKGLAVAVEGHYHVKDFWRSEDLRNQVDLIRVEQLFEVGTVGQRLVFIVGIGAEDGVGLAVADVDVVDGERITVYGIDHGLEGGIVANGGGGQLAQLGGVVGIDLAVAEAGLKSVAEGELDLVGHHAIGVVGLLDGGVKQLADVDQRNGPRNEEHQGGDGQHEFGFQTHGEACLPIEKNSPWLPFCEEKATWGSEERQLLASSFQLRLAWRTA